MGTAISYNQHQGTGPPAHHASEREGGRVGNGNGRRIAEAKVEIDGTGRGTYGIYGLFDLPNGIGNAKSREA